MITKPKHAGGRPRITLDSLPDNWQETMLDLMSQGCSDIEVRAKLCINNGKFSHRVWYALQEREQEFSDTLKKGRVLCQAWWEEQGRTSLKAQNFQTGLWYANMKNRFRWRDNHDTEGGTEIHNHVTIYRPKRKSKESVASTSRATRRSVL